MLCAAAAWFYLQVATGRAGAEVRSLGAVVDGARGVLGPIPAASGLGRSGPFPLLGFRPQKRGGAITPIQIKRKCAEQG